MKTILKITVIVTALICMVPEANAIFGVRRRTAFRTAVVVSSAESAKVAQSQQQAAASQQQAAAATAQAAAATAEAAAVKAQAAAAVVPPPPAASGQPLPMGTVVSALPPGCVSTPVGGVEYYYGGGNFYKAVFQGNNLVYVTVQPK
jgi:hypothetical protein